MEVTPKIEQICYNEHTAKKQRVEIVGEMQSAAELYCLLDHYNWDDGYGVPHAISDHPLCDLAIAQRLYWLASADDWYQAEAEPGVNEKEWCEFSKKLIQRLLSGKYQVGSISHSEGFNKVSVYYFKKRNLPDVFYQPIIGNCHG